MHPVQDGLTRASRGRDQNREQPEQERPRESGPEEPPPSEQHSHSGNRRRADREHREDQTACFPAALTAVPVRARGEGFLAERESEGEPGDEASDS